MHAENRSRVIVQDTDGEAFLRTLGERVRELRARRGMTRRSLARESGVSERYLAQLEAGRGNASVLVIRHLARAFGVVPEALVAESDPAPETAGVIATIRSLSPDQLRSVQHFVGTMVGAGDHAARAQRIALIGLRGGGKTTLGTLLAHERGIPFVELDREIERDAGVTLSTIFEFYGQAGYRRHERACLERLLDTEPRFVLATGGSIVSEAPTFQRLLAACYTVWVSASPQEHMARVVAQGDMRPMAGNREAMNDLERILAGRDALYRRADVEVSTAGGSVDDSLIALRAAVPE
jgi:XRE family transcriptional regulator, aerobic/anaerobic benzoate catabolism transcriptional regulator